MDTDAMIARFVAAAEKLLLETERLHRDVIQLNNRIVPFETEKQRHPTQVIIAPRLKYPIQNALAMIEGAREHILNCERDVSAIRGRVDAIENNAISREDMKGWIKKSDDDRE